MRALTRALIAAALFVPTIAVAQMVEHRPPPPIPMPNTRDLNYLGTDDSGRPTCSYVISSTSSRPREHTSAVVALELSPGGVPTNAEISDSTGNTHLDEASLMCAKSWRYTLAPRPTQLAVTSVKLEIRWRAPGPPGGPQDDELFVGRPVLEGTQILDVSL